MWRAVTLPPHRPPRRENKCSAVVENHHSTTHWRQQLLQSYHMLLNSEKTVLAALLRPKVAVQKSRGETYRILIAGEELVGFEQIRIKADMCGMQVIVSSRTAGAIPRTSKFIRDREETNRFGRKEVKAFMEPKNKDKRPERGTT